MCNRLLPVLALSRINNSPPQWVANPGNCSSQRPLHLRGEISEFFSPQKHRVVSLPRISILLNDWKGAKRLNVWNEWNGLQYYWNGWNRGLLTALGASAVNSPAPFLHFDVSGIAETWKCRPSLPYLEH